MNENLYDYLPGGTLYQAVASRWGQPAADRVAAAAQTGDQAAVNSALSDARRGTTDAQFSGSTSTLGNFWDQITTDPLAAPLDGLNNQLGNAVWNVFKNPFVLLLAAGLVFYWLGGFGWLKRRFA